ncbi:hypothetical protein ACSZMV_00315 [Aeromonas veronii]
MIQVDIYQKASDGRAGRDQLLSEVLAELVPSTAGTQMPGTTLLSMSVSTISLESEEVGSDTMITSIHLRLTYTASL